MSNLGYQADLPGLSPPPPPGGPSPESLAARVRAAVAAVEPGKRGRLIFSLSQQRAAIDLMWKVGGPIELVARVERIPGRPISGEILVNVNFLTSERVREPREDDLRWKDCYDALRTPVEGVRRNSRFRAFLKALAMDKLGARPFLDGREWFAHD